MTEDDILPTFLMRFLTLLGSHERHFETWWLLKGSISVIKPWRYDRIRSLLFDQKLQLLNYSGNIVVMDQEQPTQLLLSHVLCDVTVGLSSLNQVVQLDFVHNFVLIHDVIILQPWEICRYLPELGKSVRLCYTVS